MSAAAAVPQLASAHTLIPKVEEDVEETSKDESPEVQIFTFIYIVHHFFYPNCSRWTLS